MRETSVLDMLNKMIMEAEEKLGIAIKRSVDQNNLQEIKRLITYLKERQEKLSKNN